MAIVLGIIVGILAVILAVIAILAVVFSTGWNLASTATGWGSLGFLEAVGFIAMAWALGLAFGAKAVVQKGDSA